MTTHFTFEEMTRTSYPVKNEPTEEHYENMLILCEKVLEPARLALGPIKVNSGYRSRALNKMIKGAANSHHCRGMAADLDLWRRNKLLFEWIDKNCEFTQLIWEFGDNTNPRWVHISYDPNDLRNEKLKADKRGGRTVYTRL